MCKKTYEEMIEDVRNTEHYKLKEIIFSVTEEQMKKIKDLNLDKETEKMILEMIKNRSYLDFLIINAFVKTSVDILDFEK